MATQILTATLGLSAANAINGIFSLNASETDSISYDDTAASSATITVATGSASQLVDKTVVTAKVTYAYIKNLDTTNFITLYNDDAEDWGRLLPGEFAFFPIAPSVGFEVKADTAACVVEYALFEQP
tara:strand:+ start:2624 stop:3004 length:381 start_codon:yes stop_codon:yes gene_type:complete